MAKPFQQMVMATGLEHNLDQLQGLLSLSGDGSGWQQNTTNNRCRSGLTTARSKLMTPHSQKRFAIIVALCLLFISGCGGGGGSSPSSPGVTDSSGPTVTLNQITVQGTTNGK